MSLKRTSRTNSSIREITVIPDFCPNAAGSVLFGMGNTRLICAVHFSNEVPEHAKNKNTGWLSAEYTMLPYSTPTRKAREFQKRDGRSVEIQRLIGRSLRAGIDLSLIPGISLFVDCDVVEADGGTRTAAITGGYLAMIFAVNNMLKKGIIKNNPLTKNIAALSAGIVNGEILLDLDYKEDFNADVDINIVMNSSFEIVEVQGTGEDSTFTIEELNSIFEITRKGIARLIEIQNNYAPLT